MSVVAIEINDAGLTLADESGVRVSEPGYALLDRSKIVTGTAAYAQARLRPRQVSNRFWSQLSAEPGSAGLDSIYSTADLAFTQLDALWREVGAPAAEVLLVVPSHYRGEQLGLLLGLAQEVGMKVRAMLDVAVAASVSPFPGHQLVHVDASLHDVTATVLDQGSEVAVRTHQTLSGAGIASIVDQIAHRIAELFVLATRFDPFHHAESEQLVYDRLPEWLTRLHREEHAELVLPYGGEQFRVTVTRDQLLGVAHGFYRGVVQLIAQHREPGQSLVVQLSERLAALPSFVQELRRLDDSHVEALPRGHAARAAVLAAASLPAGEAVKLVKHLPWRGPPREVRVGGEQAADAPARASEDPATHVVYAGVAYRVGAEGLLVGREAAPDRRTIVIDGGHSGVSRAHCELVFRDGELHLRDLSRYGTFVNEKRISAETVLRKADVIRVGTPGALLTAVALESGDAA